jgi:transcription-repair coupling factor (superfamily II helicase)
MPKAISPSVTTLAGVPTAAWGPLVAHALEPKGKPAAKAPQVALVVVPEAGALELVANSLRVLIRHRDVRVFPAWDVNPYDRVGPSAEVDGERLSVVDDMMRGEPMVLVTSVAALGVRVPPAVGNRASEIVLEPGQRVNLAHLAVKLTDAGYTRQELVDGVGQFAIRGGLLDVWPAAEPEPLRVDMFDDEIESIRAFEPSTQKSTEQRDRAVLGRARMAATGEDEVRNFRAAYREHFPDGTQDETYTAISEGLVPPESGQFLPLFFDEPMPSLMALLPPQTHVFVPDTLQVQAEGWDELVQQAYEARKAGGGIRAIPPQLLYVGAAEMLGALGGFAQTRIMAFDSGEGEPSGLRAHMFATGNRHTALQTAAKEVSARLAEGWRVALTAPTAPALAQFLRALEGEGVPPAPLYSEFKAEASYHAAVCGLKAGWVDAPHKQLVLTEGDVFGARLGAAPKKRKRSPEEMIAHFSVLHEGDYVVHETHGIGQYVGLSTIEIEGKKQDFVRLVYAGDDRLLVPVENLDLLSRYKGAEAGHVVLDKLGTGGWELRKAAVKEDLMAMADELLATAAAREMVEREHIPATAVGYDAFCAAFPYPLTEDQQRVMEDIEADFERGVPMDRLVVGDVGFGKTEVALRAAYLVAASGRQVAVVCPTTLLARQHFEVFSERFAGYPLRVGRLSRMVNAAETKRTKEGLKEGSIDVVVGTHAVLSKDLAFKNLGLIVVDEEQRFGVAHKEKLKQIRAEVDVLTLTATPIPRTLQMAVGGVRQLSLITTPPVDRQAVQTHVLGWDNVTLKAAITRELVRGGQVYVVAPHVEDLPRLQDDLGDLVPSARIGVAHGQMPEGQLEVVMEAFYEGKLDILLATTIIESGLDVPRANTMIVYRSDRFGLAQLYQLRGRVGRSTAKAFAYFLLPEQGTLGAEAAKRLQILQRLDGLGAGFTLASYDMDLRGFGNLLGKQQSGNIRDIGFELYTKLLKEAVAAAASRKARKEKEVPVDETLRSSTVSMKLGLTYLIPESYVADEATRLDLYRRLARGSEEEAESAGPDERLQEFRAEMVDRFGPLPAEVDALLQVVSLKHRAALLNISKLEVGDKGVVVAFERGKFINPAGLIALIQKLSGILVLRPAGRGQELVWHRRLGEGMARLKGVGVILAELEGAARP